MSLLIVTDSRDYTTDLIVQRLDHAADRVFRFNLDLIHDYRLEVTPTRFVVVDPLGRVADSDTVTKFYWRKPVVHPQPGDEGGFSGAELWQAVKAMLRLCWEQRKVVLVEPLSESYRLDKLRQLRIAAAHFRTPQTAVVCGRLAPDLPGRVVVKSLSGETVGNKRLYTRLVEQSALSTRHPWFMQQLVPARYDLTVVCVRDRQFAFTFDRGALGDDVDWRSKAAHHGMNQWTPATLPPAVAAAISAFMRAAGLHFGRLDFLWDGGDAPVFCEVNPNGQFAWLDLDGSRGILGAVADAVSPATPVVPIPTPLHPMPS